MNKIKEWFLRQASYKVDNFIRRIYALIGGYAIVYGMVTVNVNIALLGLLVAKEGLLYNKNQQVITNP